MYAGFVKLGIAALFPVLASGIFYFAEKKSSFGKLPYLARQAIIGLVFGGVAIIGTEWGISISGATVNCRDAAPLCAGLLFGAPAGIIAGIIGGLERWFAVAWGAGTFTRTACSVSTLISGFYAAALRKYMFDDKKPGWAMALAIGLVMEIFHLTMVFVTNFAEAERAALVVKTCTIPMVAFNSLSVMLATQLISALSFDKARFRTEKARISQTIQRWLLVCVLFAFVATSIFTYALQNSLAEVETSSLLSLSIRDVQDDIQDASDSHLIELTHTILNELGRNTMEALSEKYGVDDIILVGSNGIIGASLDKTFIGYDMASGEQSAEFLCLISEKEEYVQSYGPISYDATQFRKFAGVHRVGGGFIQVGYGAEQFQKDLSVQVKDATHNRHVGETGYIIIASNNGRIASAPSTIRFRTLAEAGLIAVNGETAEDTLFTATVNGKACYCMYSTTEGYNIVAVLPAEEALSSRDTVLYVNTFMEVLAFAAMFAMIYFLIKKIVVNNIRSINETLAEITDGNLDLTVNVRSSEEFSSLSDDINSTVDTLKHYIDEAAARIDKELEFARSIQSSALPSVFPAFPKRKDIDIHALMDTAKEVGGDFYDFYLAPNDRLYFLIADVSGKGIPAAMFMMRAKTQLKSLAETGMPLSEVFTIGNTDLCEGNDAGMFVTSWMGMLDLKTGHVQYVNAGHNFPIVRHGDGGFAFEKCRPGLVLGGMEGLRYRLYELDLQPNDVIFLYTDGVTEATDANTELFGDDRLLACANSLPFTDMRSLCDGIKAGVDAFVGDAPQFDDITMLALQYKGTAPCPEVHRSEASIADIPEITEFFEQELEKLDCPMKTVITLNIAIDEIYSNICKFAYNGKPGPATVRLEHSEDPRSVTLVFVDDGVPYNPLKKEDPDITKKAEEREIGGLGIYMVKQSMDDMIYEYRNEQNILRLVKNY